ncbi:MAG: hypothetical protein ACREND_03975 [Gemmatimonadaceae bacterium]
MKRRNRFHAGVIQPMQPKVSTQGCKAQDDSYLALIGASPLERAIVAAVLKHPASDRGQLSRALHLAPSDAPRLAGALDRLVVKKILVGADGHGRCYSANRHIATSLRRELAIAGEAA